MKEVSGLSYIRGRKNKRSYSDGFRDYQKQIIKDGVKIISRHGFVYLAMEVRTGKTFTALGIAQKLYVSKVLFVTKKKAISSIEADYQSLLPTYWLDVINYESLHKVEGKYDLIIFDEAHGMGAFQNPSKELSKPNFLLWKINVMLYYYLELQHQNHIAKCITRFLLPQQSIWYV